MFLVRGLGLRSANLLIQHFKQPERVFESTRDELVTLGVPPEVADDLLSSKSEQRAQAEWDRAQQLGVTILDILDPLYPPLLREIYDPRPDKIIFIKGDPSVIYQDMITAMDVARGAGVKVIGIPPKDTK